MNNNHLWEIMVHSYEFSCRKHDLHPSPEQYALQQIEEMTRQQFVEALEDALLIWLPEQKI